MNFNFSIFKNCCARSQSAVKADLTQTLFTDCIESDFDSSGTFSDQEIQILEVRMQNLPGIQVNHGLLVAKGSDCKLESLLALLTPLDRTDLSDDRRIFRFDEDHLPQPPKLS